MLVFTAIIMLKIKGPLSKNVQGLRFIFLLKQSSVPSPAMKNKDLKIMGPVIFHTAEQA